MSEHKLLGGTDGFRGRAELSNPDMGHMNEVTVANLSAALVDYQREQGVEGPIVIARDTRPTGRRLTLAAIGGVMTQGAEIIDLDVAPTPMAQRVADMERAAATIVLTASHNVFSDNGWKGMLGSVKPTEKQSRAISDKAWDMAVTHSGEFGQAPGYEKERVDGYRKGYIKSVVDDVERSFGERPLAGKIVVVDGANGAAQNITPTIFTKLGAEVREFCCDGEGMINDGCGAADLTGLKAFLASSSEDLLGNPDFLGAVANDGDADRMMAVGVLQRNGKSKLVEVDGNHAMWVLAQGPGIVGTDYTNSGLVTRLQQDGIAFEYCKNGDSYVTQALKDKQALGQPWTRGGEFTGHFVDLNWLSSGDGPRTAALFAATIAQRGMTFGDVYTALPLWHQKMSKVQIDGTPKEIILEDERLLQAINEAQQELGAEGRLLLRPSGTEPVFRVWGEAVQPAQLDKVVKQLAGIVHQIVQPRLA
ncbi:phosphoglucosamine mutase [soil metagenome]